VAEQFEAAMKEIMAEYEQARKDITKMQDAVEGAAGSARSKNRMISAAVDGRGEVTEVKFHGQNWRSMAPGELGKLVVATITAAREAAQKQMWSSMESMAPAGLDLSAAMSGRLDWSAATPEAIELPQVVKDFLMEQPRARLDDADGERPSGRAERAE
jgi:DNA-binding protein YbaB